MIVKMKKKKKYHSGNNSEFDWKCTFRSSQMCKLGSRRAQLLQWQMMEECFFVGNLNKGEIVKLEMEEEFTQMKWQKTCGVT